MDIAIGRCGLACEICKHFNNGCLGCEEENRLIKRCIVYNCAVEKNIRFCLQCSEHTCNLMKGLSKSYCPVYSQIKLD